MSFDKTVVHERKCLSFYIYLCPQESEVVPNHTLPLEGAHSLASKKSFSESKRSSVRRDKNLESVGWHDGSGDGCVCICVGGCASLGGGDDTV